MLSFPFELHIKNADTFADLFNTSVLCPKVRRVIYEMMLSRSDTNEVFNIGSYCLENNLTVQQREYLVNVCLPKIRAELERLGWTTRICFYGNALFIYNSAAPPENLSDF